MGADYLGQEKAIQELQNLSDDAKEFLSHHIRNSLTVIIGGVNTGKYYEVVEAAWHIVQDIEKIGC